MKKIEIELERDLAKEEERLISFVSKKIQSYSIENGKLILTVEDDAEEELIQGNFKQLINMKKVEKGNTVIKENYIERDYVDFQTLLDSGIVEQYGTGCILLSELGQKLFDFFDQNFLDIISDLSPVHKQFPTLLPLNVVEDTKYLHSSPQYLLFCSKLNESLDEYNQVEEKYANHELSDTLNSPEFALSPSACFHLFGYLYGKSLKKENVFTLRQNVFRNEGRFNWKELTRLQDYNVREIVMIGSRDYVNSTRELILTRAEKLFDDLGMNYSISVASDPFVMPTMQGYKRIQKFNKVKYELGMYVNKETTVACASFNLHGTTFSSKFKFHAENTDVTESACIGFGIERIIIAFLSQYGTELEKWPVKVKEFIKGVS